MRKKNDPYGFNDDSEYKKYTAIGSKNSKKKSFDKYTDWRDDLLVRHNNLIDGDNNENFVHYIMGKLDYYQMNLNAWISIILPLLLAVFSILFASASGEKGSQAGIVIALVLVVVLYEIVMLSELFSNRKRISFYKDILSIFQKK